LRGLPNFDPEHFRRHLTAAGAFYLLAGMVMLLAAIGMWRGSRSAAAVWRFVIHLLTVVALALFLFQPFRYPFQQPSLVEVLILGILSAGSWLVLNSGNGSRQATSARLRPS
jgi:hypothetical membrane protein